jgi:hypothetical protein
VGRLFHLGGAITFLSSARRRRGFYARLRAATIGKTLDRAGAPVLWRRRNRADGGDMIRRRAALAAGLANTRQAKRLGVAQIARHQSPAEFGNQISGDGIFFADLIKTLDIKLE